MPGHNIWQTYTADEHGYCIKVASLSVHPILNAGGLDSDAARIDMRSYDEQLPCHWLGEGRET